MKNLTLLVLFLNLILLSVVDTFSQINNCNSFSLNIESKDINCNGGQDGSIVVTPMGNGPYSITWTPTIYTGDSIGNLPAGTYIVTVVDSSINTVQNELVVNGDFESGNNSFTSNYGYDNISPLNEGMYFVADNGNALQNFWSACSDHTFGNSNGHMMLVNGSTTPNVELWCQTINVQQNKNYDFSCWVTSVYYQNPPILQFSVNNTLLGSPFQASLYTCQWTQFHDIWYSGMNTTADICIVNQNTIGSGNDFAIDDISFKESSYCTVSDSIIISEPEALVIDTIVNQPVCSSAEYGKIEVIVTGGIAPYNYNWNTGDTTSLADSLLSGTYVVQISDQNGCTSNDVEIYIEPPSDSLVISATVSHVSCNQGSNGYIQLEVNGGTPEYSILWDNGSFELLLDSLHAGVYSVTIQDSNGCIAEEEFSISEPDPIELNYIIQNISCYEINDGSVEVVVTGGIQPYTYSWSNGNFSQEINNLQAGVYSVIVTDSAGCQESANFTVTEPPILQIELDTLYTVDISDGISLNPKVTGGVLPYFFEWQYNGINGCSSCQEQIVFPGGESQINLFVYDANGCPVSTTVYIEVLPDLFIPNTFTPNSDHLNDVFKPVIRGEVASYNFKVYNRWGQLVFETSKTDEGWDGYYQGAISQIDTYVYSIDVKFQQDVSEEYRGKVNLIR